MPAVTVQDFTGVYAEQPFMQELRRSATADGEIRWFDCTQIDGSDCYCDDEAQAILSQQIESVGNNTIGIHFFDQVVGDSNNDDVLHELVVVQNLFNPAAATQDSFESGRLHIGVVVEYHQVKRLLNAVRPELAHIVVIAVVKEMNAEGIVAYAFDLLAENGLGFVVAVAVGAVNLSAIKPMDILAGSRRL